MSGIEATDRGALLECPTVLPKRTRLGPVVVAQDHRSVGWGTLSGPAGWVKAPRALIALAPDARLRIDHLRTSGRGILFENTWLGTRDGGAFEIPQISVFELDALGRQLRLDLYDLAQLDQALARFGSLGDPSPLAPEASFENAAARADRRLFACFSERDWAGVEALAARDLIFDERRRLVRNTCGRVIWLEQFRTLFDLPRSHFTSGLLAMMDDAGRRTARSCSAAGPTARPARWRCPVPWPSSAAARPCSCSTCRARSRRSCSEACTLPDLVEGIAAAGNHVFVADGMSGLRVINVSNPAAPVEVGVSDVTNEAALDVAVAGSHAYVAYSTLGLRVIDVSVPSLPGLVGAIDTPGTAMGVAVAGSHAYVEDGGSGLRVISIANPAAPVEVGVLDTPNYTTTDRS